MLLSKLFMKNKIEMTDSVYLQFVVRQTETFVNCNILVARFGWSLFSTQLVPLIPLIVSQMVVKHHKI